MRLTATKVFLGMLLTGIYPNEALALPTLDTYSKQTFEFLAVDRLKVIGDRPSAFQSGLSEDMGIGINATRSDLEIEPGDNYSKVIDEVRGSPVFLRRGLSDLYSGDFTQKATFTAGVASWQSKNRFCSWKFDGKFDDSARFIKGKAYLATPSVVGLIDLSIDLNEQIELKTVTGWQTNTPLGSLAVKGNFNKEIVFTGANAAWNAQTKLGAVSVNGNFDRDTNFSGGNAAWNAKTKLGAVSINGNFDRDTNFSGGNAAWNAKTSIASFNVKGNFDRETNFTGGNFKIGSQALIGSFQANIKINEESKFKGGNASWNTNLLFGSNVGFSGRFDDTNTFSGGSIKLGAKSDLGTMGVKANLDRDTQFTSGSAFWKTKTKVGSLNLDADIKKDGNFTSKIAWEFPF